MSQLDRIFATLAANPQLHVPGTQAYLDLKAAARAEIEALFRGTGPEPRPFGPFGPVAMPYTRMGEIDSLDLFGLDELIIFSFYHANRRRYARALDVGANLGLHSIILAKCGFEVRAFEPDPRHFAILAGNLKANAATRVQPFQAAVSTVDGTMQFVRVLGNTTGSHLSGAKESYGDREFFDVRVVALPPLLEWADLAKIDAEGHEKVLLLAATTKDFAHIDVMVEIGSPANAHAVFEHLSSIGVGMFPQKLAWKRADRSSDLPTSHREGSLFISSKEEMPW
jgi:FkbM family methyltransferase